jgi:hypothetical protein
LAQIERFAKTDSNKAISSYRVDYLQPIVFVDSENHSNRHQDRSDSIEAMMTPEGFLRLTGRISGVGVYQYSDGETTWGELRLPEHVFEQASLDSFKMKPVTDDHPDEFVTSENIHILQKGNLGSDIRPDPNNQYVLADMLITSPDLIEKIKSGKTQLSNGYEVIAVEEEGTYNGTPYKYIQTAIRGNHTAIVDQARGGELCRLLIDSKGAYSIKDSNMKVKNKDAKIMLGEMEYEVPEEVAMLLKELQEKVAEQGAELAELKAEKPMEEMPEAEDMEGMEKEEAPEEMKADSVALRATVDSLKAQIEGLRKEFSHKVDARVKLVTKAKELAPGLKTDGLSDEQIMVAVTKVITPAIAPKLDKASPDYIKAAYDVAISSHLDHNDSSNDLLTLTHEAAKNDGDTLSDLDALYTTRLAKMKGIN